MKKSKFSKPPLTHLEKEKKAEEFLNFSESESVKIREKNVDKRVTVKEPVKALALRFPVSLSLDIAEISAITGLSMNAICVELLRPAVKNKLKNLKEE